MKWKSTLITSWIQFWNHFVLETLQAVQWIFFRNFQWISLEQPLLYCFGLQLHTMSLSFRLSFRLSFLGRHFVGKLSNLFWLSRAIHSEKCKIVLIFYLLSLSFVFFFVPHFPSNSSGWIVCSNVLNLNWPDSCTSKFAWISIALEIFSENQLKHLICFEQKTLSPTWCRLHQQQRQDYRALCLAILFMSCFEYYILIKILFVLHFVAMAKKVDKNEALPNSYMLKPIDVSSSTVYFSGNNKTQYRFFYHFWSAFTVAT